MLVLKSYTTVIKITMEELGFVFICVFFILSEASSSLVPREMLVAAPIIKKKTLRSAVDLPRTVLNVRSVYHCTLLSMRQASAKIKLVKAVIPFDPEKHTLAFLV